MTEEQIREAAANYTKENWTQISRVQDLLIRDGYVSGASSLLPKIKELEEQNRVMREALEEIKDCNLPGKCKYCHIDASEALAKVNEQS